MTKTAIYLRLSRADDESTSLDVQRRACRAALVAQGHDPARALEYPDDGVSGATPLDRREGMAALMADQPDLVVAWKLDRYARSLLQFADLVKWAQESGVTLTTADGNLNTSSAGGRMVANVLATFAEYERELIAERITAGHKERREQGRWPSGRAPFPFRIVRRDGAAYLDHDPSLVKQCLEQIDAFLSGGNYSSTSRHLPISLDQWRRTLQGVSLRGWREYRGQLVVQEDGHTPVQFAPEVVDAATYTRIQKRCTEVARSEVVNRPGTPVLSKMIWCVMKGTPHKMIGGTARGKRCYRCEQHCGAIMAELVEPAVHGAFLDRWGSTPLEHVEYIGGTDHSAAIADLEAGIERLLTAIEAGSGESVERLAKRLAERESELSRLRAEHSPEVREVRTPLDTPMYEPYMLADKGSRRAVLLDYGLRVEISRGPDRVAIGWERSGEAPSSERVAEWARLWEHHEEQSEREHGE